MVVECTSTAPITKELSIYSILYIQKTDFEQMTLKSQEIRGSFHIGNNHDMRAISQQIALILAK